MFGVPDVGGVATEEGIAEEECGVQHHGRSDAGKGAAESGAKTLIARGEREQEQPEEAMLAA